MRANTRTSVRTELEVSVDLESDHHFYTGLTRNISAGGVFVATHDLGRIGDRVNLQLKLPGDPGQVLLETEVRWIRENSALQRQHIHVGMGLQFVNLSPEAASTIQRFLDKRDSIYHDDE